MGAIRTDKVYTHVKADASKVFFRYDIDELGAYDFVFKTGTNAADKLAVISMYYFQNVIGYPGATTSEGDVIDPLMFTTAGLVDGTALNPALFFQNETDLGFYRSMAGTVALTKNLQVGFNTAVASKSINLNAQAGQLKILGFQSGGLDRWRLYQDNVAESGGNVGSNLVISRFDDAGNYIDQSMTIARSTGIWTINASNIIVNSAGSANSLELKSSAGFIRRVNYTTGGLSRFDAGVTSDAESTGNLGSNYAIKRYDDAGTLIDTVFGINRATGIITFSKDLIINGGSSVNSALNARAPRAGLVFDGTAITAPAIVGLSAFGQGVAGSTAGDFTTSLTFNPSAILLSYLYFAAGDTCSAGTNANGSISFFTGGSLRVITPANSLTIGKSSTITYVRSSGVGTAYIDGVSVASAADLGNCSAAITQLASNTQKGTISGLAFYNRALSASEVAALAETGRVAQVDMPITVGQPAGVELIAAAADRTFSSDTLFWNKGTGVTIPGDGLCHFSSVGQYVGLGKAGSIVIGRRYRVQFTMSNYTAGAAYIGGATGATGNFTADGLCVGEFTAATTTTGVFGLNASNTFNITNVSIIPLGAVLAPDPVQRMTPSATTWYDTSGNSSNLTWSTGVTPAVVSSYTLPLGGGATITGTSTGETTFLQSAVDKTFVFKGPHSNLGNYGSGNLQIFSTDSVAANKGGAIVFGGIYTGTSQVGWAAISGYKDTAIDSQYGGYLSLYSRAHGGQLTECVRLTSGGNLGLGFTAPLSKLAINGGLHVGGESDAGDNNLLVDGIATVTGNVSTGATAGFLANLYYNSGWKYTASGSGGIGFYPDNVYGRFVAAPNNAGAAGASASPVDFALVTLATKDTEFQANLAAKGNVTNSLNSASLNGLSATRVPGQTIVYGGVNGDLLTGVPVFGTGTAGSTIGDFSVGAWIVPTGVTAAQAIFGGPNNTGFVMVLGSGKLKVGLQAVLDESTSTTTLIAGIPVFVCYTRSGTTGTYYVNGVADGTVTGGDDNAYSGGISYVGSTNNATTNPYTGNLRPFAANRALTASEIQSIYNGSTPADLFPATAAGTTLITGNAATFSDDSPGQTYWTLTGVTISGGEAIFTGANQAIERANVLTVGMKYRLTIDASQASSFGWYLLNGSFVGIPGTGTGTKTIDFTATSTTLYVNNGNGTDGKLTSISLIPLGATLWPSSTQPGSGDKWYSRGSAPGYITRNDAGGNKWGMPAGPFDTENRAYGGLYIHDSNSGSGTSQSLTSSYSKVVAFNVSGGATGKYFGMVPSTANSNIVATYPGTYRVSYTVSGTSGTASHEIHGVVFAGTAGATTEVISTENGQTSSSAGSRMLSVGGVGMVTLTAGQVIELYLKDITGSSTFTIYQSNLVVDRMGD